MIVWRRRAPEIANLLNPAFCSIIIYSAVFEYQKKAKKGFPFPSIYLVLPLILHKNTRDRVNSRTNMMVWLQRNPDTLIGFADRARSLLSFANESIEFLLHQKIITISNGELEITKTLSKSKLSQFTAPDQEIVDCLQKAEHVGRWFAQMGAEENIFAAWGVKP